MVEETPSLAPHASRLEKADANGGRIAQGETGVAIETCSWTIAQVLELDHEFWPLDWAIEKSGYDGLAQAGDVGARPARPAVDGPLRCEGSRRLG